MKRLKAIALIGTTALLGMSDFDFGLNPQLSLLSTPAQAQRYEPHVTANGVARRTARRTVGRELRQTAVTFQTLPPGCVPASMGGLHYYDCGGMYLQSSGGIYVQVVIE
jgi:Flp pilus assembly protein CpaB